MEIRQYAATQLRGVDREARTIDFVASDNSIDSYNTRIDQNGWVLDQYQKNPVMCWAHDDRGYTGSNGLPIAKAAVRVENGKLIGRATFPSKGTVEIADQVFELAAQGILRGISVGFEPLEWEDKDESMDDGHLLKVRVYKKQRLMEISFVTIPSNDNALVVRSKQLNKDESIVRKMTEQIEESLKKVEHVERKVGDITITLSAKDAEAFDAQAKESEKFRSYFEQKQPVNKIASGVMEKFFKRILKEEQPAEEKAAWQRMEAAIEAMEESEETPEETPPATAVEAPQPERKASVQVPIDLLAKLPSEMTRQFLNVGVEALRRGATEKDAGKIIDGLKKSVSSLTSL